MIKSFHSATPTPTPTCDHGQVKPTPLRLVVDSRCRQNTRPKLPGGYVQGTQIQQFHDLGELDRRVGGEVKLLGFYPRGAEMVAGQLHVRVDPGVRCHRPVVEPPIEDLGIVM